MRPKTILMISLIIVLASCTTASPPLSDTQVNYTETSMPALTPSATPIPTTLTPRETVVFMDNFDSESLNTKWNLLEGDPKLGRTLATGKEKISLQIDNDVYPSDFTIQFDINQCGNDGYLQLTIGNQLQFEFLSDLSTNQRVHRNNDWQELSTGRIHRCAAHIVISIKSSSYIILNVHNDETIKILEGKIEEDFYGPLTFTLTPYASIDNFLFTIP
jgi:hypothetical protein